MCGVRGHSSRTQTAESHVERMSIRSAVSSACCCGRIPAALLRFRLSDFELSQLLPESQIHRQVRAPVPPFTPIRSAGIRAQGRGGGEGAAQRGALRTLCVLGRPSLNGESRSLRGRWALV